MTKNEQGASPESQRTMNSNYLKEGVAIIRHKCGHEEARVLTKYDPHTKRGRALPKLNLELNPPKVLVEAHAKDVASATKRAQRYWGDKLCTRCFNASRQPSAPKAPAPKTEQARMF